MQCLDVLRAAGREPATVEALVQELRASRGADRRYDALVERLETDLRDARATDGAALESRARWLTERLALALQGALFVRHAPPAVADAFCASRLASDRTLAFSALPSGTDFDAIIGRARPRVDRTAR